MVISAGRQSRYSFLNVMGGARKGICCCLADKRMDHMLAGLYNAITHERDMENSDRWGLQFAVTQAEA